MSSWGQLSVNKFEKLPKMEPNMKQGRLRARQPVRNNLHTFRSMFLYIFFRLMDPPIFKNEGFPDAKCDFQEVAFRKNVANTIPQGSLNHLKIFLKL